MTKQQYNLRMEREQLEALSQLRQQTGITVSELMRKMVVYCTQGQVINEVIPCMSGQLILRRMA